MSPPRNKRRAVLPGGGRRTRLIAARTALAASAFAAGICQHSSSCDDDCQARVDQDGLTHRRKLPSGARATMRMHFQRNGCQRAAPGHVLQKRTCHHPTVSEPRARRTGSDGSNPRPTPFEPPRDPRYENSAAGAASSADGLGVKRVRCFS